MNEFKYTCSSTVCEGWYKPFGHSVKDKSVEYRKKVDLWLCNDCFRDWNLTDIKNKKNKLIKVFLTLYNISEGERKDGT